MTRGERSKARLLDLAREWEAEAAQLEEHISRARLDEIGGGVADWKRRIAAHFRALAAS